MALITFEDGILSLDGEEIQGIVTSLRVAGKVRFDEQKVDGSSGKKKTPQGFEDAEISVSLSLLTEEKSSCYDKLEKITSIFRGLDGKSNPKIYSVTNRHLLARGVRQVVFADFASMEDERSDEITVRISFVEHNPPIVRLEEAQAKAPTQTELKELAESAQAESAEPEFVLTGSLQ